MRRMLLRIARLDAHHRALGAVIAAAFVAVCPGRHPLWTRSLATYDTFALVSLALISITIAFNSCQEVRLIAQRQDLGRTIIFMVVIGAACAAVFAVAFLIRGVRTEARAQFTLHLLLAITTVILSWLLVHTIFGLRYAHNFYGDRKHKTGNGLLFPGEKDPDYRDFTYFSFVIGMTCQVSDVQVTSREMRRLVLVHGVLSFAFNTVILALTINTVSGLF